MRRLQILSLGAAALLAVGAVRTAAPSRADGVAVAVLDGKGFGHGVGMAQDGDYWMGRAGATTGQILGQFYPGTTIGKGAAELRVAVGRADGAGNAVLSFPAGGEVRDARSGTQSAGFPVRVGPGGQVQVHWDGARYTVTVAGSGAAASTAGPSERTATTGSFTATGTATTGTATTGTATTVTTAAAPRASSRQVVPQQVPDTSTTTTTSPAPSIPTTTTTTPPPSPTTTPTSPPPAPSPTTTTTTSPAPPTTSTTAPPAPAAQGPSSSRPLFAVPSGSGTVGLSARNRQYRGIVEATAEGTPLRLVDLVDVEQYLRGMGEVRDPSWPAASLRTQAIAARTYALRAVAGGGELCDDERCQVYLGAQAEYGAMDKAVSDTRGQALFYGSTLASTVYSANGGGVSASRQEGFGEDPSSDAAYPYLRAAPYVTSDPMPWTVRVALSDLGARLGYPGTVTKAGVAAAGPSGRALSVVLDGSAGPRSVTGLNVARALSLRSNLFTIRVESDGAAPPPPPADGGAIQAPPEEAAAVAAPLLDVPAAESLVTELPPAPAAPPAARGALAIGGRHRSGGSSGATLTLAAVLLVVATAAAAASITAWRAGLSLRSLRPF